MAAPDFEQASRDAKVGSCHFSLPRFLNGSRGCCFADHRRHGLGRSRRLRRVSHSGRPTFKAAGGLCRTRCAGAISAPPPPPSAPPGTRHLDIVLPLNGVQRVSEHLVMCTTSYSILTHSIWAQIVPCLCRRPCRLPMPSSGKYRSRCQPVPASLPQRMRLVLYSDAGRGGRLPSI